MQVLALILDLGDRVDSISTGFEEFWAILVRLVTLELSSNGLKGQNDRNGRKTVEDCEKLSEKLYGDVLEDIFGDEASLSREEW